MRWYEDLNNLNENRKGARTDYIPETESSAMAMILCTIPTNGFAGCPDGRMAFVVFARLF